MNWIKKLFVGEKGEIVETKSWSGTISSEGPQQQGPVTVLTLKTEHDFSEWNEGYTKGADDGKNNLPMEDNLNFPFHPYARGYFEGYRNNKNSRGYEKIN